MSTTNAHGIKPGDIMSSTWGYSCTRTDFWMVKCVTRCTVIVSRMGQKVVESGRWGERTMPDPENVSTEERRIRLDKDRPYGWVEPDNLASPWNGKPGLQNDD